MGMRGDRVNWHTATLTELYTIAYYDNEVPLIYRIQAAREIVKREKQTRKPYRVNQQKVRIQYPK
jgi:hypothetical protein